MSAIGQYGCNNLGISEEDLVEWIIDLDERIEVTKNTLEIGPDWTIKQAIEECEKRLRNFDMLFAASERPFQRRFSTLEDLISPEQTRKEAYSDGDLSLDGLITPEEPSKVDQEPQPAELLSSLLAAVTLEVAGPQPTQEPSPIEETSRPASGGLSSDDDVEVRERALTPAPTLQPEPEKQEPARQVPTRAVAVTAHRVQNAAHESTVLLVHKCSCETYVHIERVQVPYVAMTNLPALTPNMVSAEHHQGTFGWLLNGLNTRSKI